MRGLEGGFRIGLRLVTNLRCANDIASTEKELQLGVYEVGDRE